MTVVIVEDSDVVRELLRDHVCTLPGVQVIGEAVGAQEAIELIARTLPRVVLLDLSLSPGHGFNVLKAVRAAGNRCKVLVLTNQDIAPLRSLAEGLGADGLYDKVTGIAQVLAHIQAWSSVEPTPVFD
jgi:DNA-binding NarL/FixJ family response regulator